MITVASFIMSVGTGILAGIPATIALTPSVKRLVTQASVSASVIEHRASASVAASVENVHKMFGEDYSALETRIEALEKSIGKNVDLRDFEKRLKECVKNISPFVR